MLVSIVFCILNLNCTIDFCAFPKTFLCQSHRLHTTFYHTGLAHNFRFEKLFYCRRCHEAIRSAFFIICWHSSQNKIWQKKTSFNIRDTWTKELIILIQTICLKQIYKLSIFTVFVSVHTHTHTHTHRHIDTHTLVIYFNYFICQLRGLISQPDPRVHSRMSAGVFLACCPHAPFHVNRVLRVTFSGREWHRSNHLSSVLCDKWIQSVLIILRCRVTMLHGGIYYRRIVISSWTSQTVLIHNFIIEAVDIIFSLRDLMKEKET